MSFVSLIRSIIAVLFSCAFLPLWCASAARADLTSYLRKPEPAYRWTFSGREVSGKDAIYRLTMTSQTWQGIKWEHSILIYVPEEVKPGAQMALYNTGGDPNAGNNALGMLLAKRAKVPVAFLFNVPNQPLLGDKKEDALIAETFLRYLSTQDEDWPLLFPMAKSVIKAMDAIQAFALQEWKAPVNEFVVGGASKRGWTAWLVGASADKRVKAIFPMVIDTLNMTRQVLHQRASYGATSDQISDYSKAGLTDIFTQSKGRRLILMMDPFAYRTSLTLPKLLVLGANDPYWTADSLQLYYAGLIGETQISYSPNAGHNLQQAKPDRGNSFERPVSVITAFIRSQFGIDKPMPRIIERKEKVEDFGDRTYQLTLRFNQQPTGIRLWVATSPTRDFRKATWLDMPADMSLVENAPLIFQQALPKTGYMACFAEVDFGSGADLYSLCAPVRVCDKEGIVLPR